MTETDNPFETGNMTLQMHAIRSDPEKAKQMIAAVGKKPPDFNWDGEPVRSPLASAADRR